MRLNLVRAVVAGFLATILSVASAGVAEAQAPASATPFQCLQAWDQDGESLDYVGDGWVGVRVIDVGGVFLGCGDELSGVVHIAHPDTTGTLHPIFENTQNAFIQCFQLIANSGTRRADDDFPASRTRAEFTYYVNSQFGQIPQTATIIFDNAGRFAYTVFTSSGSFSPEGNNWGGCSSNVA